MTEAWGQPAIVESKAGASGAIAASYVAKQPPDGQTLLLGYSALLSNLVLQANTPYKLSELAPVSMMASPPSWRMPTSNETRVRVDGRSKIIARVLPSSGFLFFSCAFSFAFMATLRSSMLRSSFGGSSLISRK